MTSIVIIKPSWSSDVLNWIWEQAGFSRLFRYSIYHFFFHLFTVVYFKIWNSYSSLPRSEVSSFFIFLFFTLCSGELYFISKTSTIGGLDMVNIIISTVEVYTLYTAWIPVLNWDHKCEPTVVASTLSVKWSKHIIYCILNAKFFFPLTVCNFRNARNPF